MTGYEARVHESFSRQTHMATLGVTIAYLAPGEVLVATMLSTIIVRPNR